MQFKLADLMRLMAYVAVGAWLYSMGMKYGMFAWLGTVFGLEIGIRSHYPRLPMAICGTLLATFVWAGVQFSGASPFAARLPMVGGISPWHFLLALLWLSAAAIFFWMVTRGKSPARRKSANDRYSIHANGRIEDISDADSRVAGVKTPRAKSVFPPTIDPPTASSSPPNRPPSRRRFD